MHGRRISPIAVVGFVAACGMLAGCGQRNVVLGEEQYPLADGGAEDGSTDSPDAAGAGGQAGAPAAGRDAGSGMQDAGTPKSAGPSWLPAVVGECPTFSSSGTYTFSDGAERSMQVDVHIAPDSKDKPGPGGPLILYWHSAPGDPSEVAMALGAAAIDRVVAQGGVVASFANTTNGCCRTEDAGLWFIEDEGVVDQVVACAIERGKIDTRHIHTLGFSAGGMNALYEAWSRSAYIASAASYSGGRLMSLPPARTGPEQDPANPLPTMLAYGAEDVDFILFSFKETSLNWFREQRARGAYTLMCEHGGGHEIPSALAPFVFRFFEDHPYKIDPEPYESGVPQGFPKYCTDELLAEER